MGSLRQPRKTLLTDARALVDQCAGWNSRLAARRISHFLDREMADLGLTAAQLRLMVQIAVTSDDALGALAQRTGPSVDAVAQFAHARARGPGRDRGRRERSTSTDGVAHRDRCAAAREGDPNLAPRPCQACEARLSGLGPPIGR